MPTIRQKMTTLLTEEELDVRQLSQKLGLSEKVITTHLPHIAKSVAARNLKWMVVPAVCLACGFEFKDRARVTKPGRCPRCRSERIDAPRYRIMNPK